MALSSGAITVYKNFILCVSHVCVSHLAFNVRKTTLAGHVLGAAMFMIEIAGVRVSLADFGSMMFWIYEYAKSMMALWEDSLHW